MPESFNFTWELFDKVSKSAEHIQHALEKAEHAMKHAQGEAHSGIGSWSMMGIKMGAVAGIAGELTREFMHLAGEGLGLAAEGAKWAFEAGSFAENTQISLEAVLGSKKAAQDAVREWRELTEGTPFETKQIIEWGKQLRIAGESADNTKFILKAVADVGTAMGSTKEEQAAFAEQTLQAFTNMKELGVASERSLKIFKTLGVSPLKVEQNMADRLTGGNILSLKKQMEAMRVGAPEQELAVLKAIQEKYGKIGELAEKGAGTLSSLLTRAEDRVKFDIFKGFEKTAGYKAVKQVLENFNKLLDPEGKEGKGLMAGIKSMSEGFAEWLKPLTGPEGRKNMVAFFSEMKTGVESVLPGLRVIATAVGFLAKWGVVKPLQGIGMLSDIEKDVAAIVEGKAPSSKTGKAFLEAAFGGEGGSQTGSGGYAGGLTNEAFLRARASDPTTRPTQGPGMLARPTVHVSNTFHVHGSADTDALAEKLNDLQQESFQSMIERMSIFAGGGAN